MLRMERKLGQRQRRNKGLIQYRLATHIWVQEQRSEKQVKKGKSVLRPDGISVTYWYFSICNFHDSMENRKNMNIYGQALTDVTLKLGKLGTQSEFRQSGLTQRISNMWNKLLKGNTAIKSIREFKRREYCAFLI